MKKIISWNVNGIRSAAKKGFFEWVRESSPDVIALQETKAHPEQLPKEFSEITDSSGTPYKAWWASAKRKGYSGVAILSKSEPLSVTQCGIPEFDDEGRVLIAEFEGFSVISAYFPNSQEAGARLDYKLAYCGAILELCDSIVSKGGNVVLSGDYNIAHKPIDLANPKANEGNPGYLPEERAWMDTFLSSGYVDTFRTFCTDPGQYTWWTYRFHAREKNVGWRLDYHCVNESFSHKVKSSIILSSVLGSDHCPVEIGIDV